MNKTELIAAMAESANISKAAAGAALNAMLGIITKSLSKGEPVIILGFGKFHTVKRSERTGRNPKTGAPIKIAAKTIAKLKAGKLLRTFGDEVNNG